VTAALAIISAKCAGPCCDRPPRALGFCWGHYMQQRRHGELTRLRGPHGKMAADEAFRCAHYRAQLSFRACIERQTKTQTGIRLRGGRWTRPAFPHCATCLQGRKIAQRFPELVVRPGVAAAVAA
jgi:hypothetical protein